jgi:hypothetical protein
VEETAFVAESAFALQESCAGFLLNLFVCVMTLVTKSTMSFLEVGAKCCFGCSSFMRVVALISKRATALLKVGAWYFR